MKIRAGYEISYDSPQPTPMNLRAMPLIKTWAALEIATRQGCLSPSRASA